MNILKLELDFQDMTLTMDVFEEWTHSNSVSVSPEVRINRNDDVTSHGAMQLLQSINS